MSDKVMDRIQKLLNQAAGAGTDEERRTFQAKADEQMHKYKIDQAMLRIRNAANAAEQRPQRNVTDETIPWVEPWDEFLEAHKLVIGYLARLAGVMIVFSGSNIIAVGYPDDISYLRMTWVNTHLTFSSKLFPQWDKTKTAGYNIRAQAESGVKWDTIWKMAVEAGDPLTHPKTGAPIPAPPGDNGWMKRQMAAAYKADGLEKPKLSHGVRNYRDSFAYGFVEAVKEQILAMTYARRERENAAGDGVSLVLRSDANAIEDYFNRLFPPGSLTSGRPVRGPKAGYGAAVEKGRAAGRAVDFNRGHGVAGGGPRRQIG